VPRGGRPARVAGRPWWPGRPGRPWWPWWPGRKSPRRVPLDAPEADG